MKKISSPDERSKKFIFVPFCVLCQAFQAQGIVRYGYKAVMKPVTDILIANDINIIQMPCPESQLGGILEGLKRGPKSITGYDTDTFRTLCKKLAIKLVEMINGIQNSGYIILGILGVEFSPSCSIKLQYSNKGTYHRPGIFIEEIQNELKRKGLEIPFLGINRRGMKKTIRELEKLIHRQETLF